MGQFRYPNESNEYRAARDALLQREIALRAETEAVAAARRELPRGGKLQADYRFEQVGPDGKVREVPFDALFGDDDQLLVYTMMFGAKWDAPCPSCTSIVDAININAYQVEDTCGMAVVSAAGPEQFHAWSKRRGWTTVNLLSAAKTTYLVDYAGFEDADDAAMVSAMNAFTRSSEGIFHTWGSELAGAPMDNGHPRHVDPVWPLWNLLDMSPEGRGDAKRLRHNYAHEYFDEHVMGGGD